MANCLFGWVNRITTAALTDQGNPAAGLGASQLQNDQGSPSTAWQSTGGFAGPLLIDTGNEASTWRAFLLARTNLTTGAIVRWRVGPRDALVEVAPAFSFFFTNSSAAAMTAAGWTFTRSTIGSIVTTPGVTMSSVAVNVPRLNADGLLMESVATNLFTFNNSATTGQSSGGGNSISALGTTMYTGSACTQAVLGATGNDTNVYFFSFTGLGIGTTYTCSIWVFVPATTTLTALSQQFEGNFGTNTVVGADLSKRNQWQRIYVTATATGTSTNMVLRLTGGVTGSNIFVCCRQMETGAVPTSYIHTAGATATRGGDNATNSSASIVAAGSGAAVTLATSAMVLVKPVTGLCDIAASKVGANANLISRYGGTAQGYALNAAGAVTSTVSQAYTAGPTNTIRNAAAYSPGTFAFQSGSNNLFQASSLVVGNLTDIINIGVLNDASVYVRSVALYTGRLPNASLTSLATSGVTEHGAVSYDSGTVVGGVVPGIGQLLTVAPAQVAGAVVRLDLVDAFNPDGFINVPLAFAGPIWEPLSNMDFASSLGRDDQVDEVSGRGGSEFPVVQWVRRRWDVVLNGIRATELWPQAMELDRVARLGGNVLFVPDPVGTDRQRETVFGRLRSAADVSYPYGAADRRSWRARITERL